MRHIVTTGERNISTFLILEYMRRIGTIIYE